VNYLKSENINLVVIKNTTLEVKTVFNNAFLMMFNPNITEYIYKNNILNVPLIIDTEFNNPVELNKNIDILYFSIGKFIASTQVKLFNKSLSPNIKVVSSNSFTQRIFKELSTFLKVSKIIYICESTKIDEITLKFIEVIATLNNVNVVYDYTFKFKPLYGHNSYVDSDNVSYMQILFNNEDYRLKKVLSKQRLAFSNNSFVLIPKFYEFLIQKIETKKTPKISIITSTNRKNNLNFYFDQINGQKDVELQINLSIHGFKLTEEEEKYFKSICEHELNIFYMDKSESLGACLNKCIDNSTFSVIAKMDDDDYYLDYYLFDQWLALNYSKADAVGKSESYWFLESEKLITKRRAGKLFQFDYFIFGATLMVKAELLKKVRFEDISKGEDTTLLRHITGVGGKIFVGHPFEMCAYRGEISENHTWQV